MAHAGRRRRGRGLAELLVGEDPTRIEHLWQMMYRQHFWHGHGIVRATAIAGIDLALWDILGKVAGCRAASSGAGRCAITFAPTATSAAARWKIFTRPPADDAKRFARSRPASGRGRLHRVQVDGRAADAADRRARSRSAPPKQRVAAMREAVGDSIDIMVDCHARPSPAMGLQFAKALEPYGLYFLEEPCWPESVDGLAVINAAVTTPIATGERVTNLAAFRDLFAAARLRHLPARHHALRRLDARPAASRPWPSAPHRAGAAQSARPGQHGGLAGVRLLAAELHHLRNGARRRAVAAGRRAGRLHASRRQGRIVRPNTRPGPGHRDQRSRSEKASRSSKNCRSACSIGRQRRGLVGRKCHA